MQFTHLLAFGFDCPLKLHNAVLALMGGDGEVQVQKEPVTFGGIPALFRVYPQGARAGAP
jgi:hypothetical protein